MSPKRVQDYFLELTGTAGLPPPIKVPGRVGGETMYVVKTDKGSFTLRDFASSTEKSGPVWTIEIPKTMVSNVNTSGKSVEIKFLK
jgi:filamentous hemagglutinin